MADERSRLRIPLGYEGWNALHNQGGSEGADTAVAALQSRGLDELRMKGWKEDEVDLVSRDEVYAESCRRVYFQTKDEVVHKRRFPRAVKVEHLRPPTRTGWGRS